MSGKYAWQIKEIIYNRFDKRESNKRKSAFEKETKTIDVPNEKLKVRNLEHNFDKKVRLNLKNRRYYKQKLVFLHILQMNTKSIVYL